MYSCYFYILPTKTTKRIMARDLKEGVRVKKRHKKPRSVSTPRGMFCL